MQSYFYLAIQTLSLLALSLLASIPSVAKPSDPQVKLTVFGEERTFPCKSTDVEAGVSVRVGMLTEGPRNIPTLDNMTLDTYLDFERIVETCKLTPEKFHMTPEQLQKIREQWGGYSFESAKARLEKGIPVDLSDVLKLAKKLGMDSKKIEALQKTDADWKQKRLSQKSKCSPKDFRSELSPTFDQDSVGWCYAYAAADLATFKLKQPISAIGIAQSYNRSTNRGWLGLIFKTMRWIHGAKSQSHEGPIFVGGTVGGALAAAALSGGVCTEKELPSEDYAISQQVTDLRKIYGNLYQLKKDIDERKVTFSCERDFVRFGKLFPTLSFTEFAETLQKSSSDDFLMDLSMRSCKHKISLLGRDFNSESVPVKSPAEGEELLAKLLNQNNIAAITVNDGFLNHPERSYKKANHALTVVGRRWNEQAGACEFIVRNPQGAGCGINQAFSCDPKTGALFIPVDVVASQSKEITYVK